MPYEHLEKYLKEKEKEGLVRKTKEKKKESSLTKADIDKLVLQMLKDFEYIE